MADYIRREDAHRMVVQLDKYAWASPVSDEHRVTVDVDLVKFGLDRIPAVDVAEVVRCKDCEHAERYERADGDAGYYCGHPQNSFTYGERWDRAFKPAKEENDFCSYGERRDGGNGDVSD